MAVKVWVEFGYYFKFCLIQIWYLQSYTILIDYAFDNEFNNDMKFFLFAYKIKLFLLIAALRNKIN